jgi:hypothetical protein
VRGPQRLLGWWRHSPANRTIGLVAGVAVVALVLGLVLGRFVISPAQAAADAAAPEGRPITVPAELRAISNDVTLRADVLYDDPQPITVEIGDLGDKPVVTGQVPAVGATLDAGGVALEVTGRPVIVLPGELPAYRTLRVGASGPDVLQFKQALAALGIGAGSPDSDVYDEATAAGVRALYAKVGYAPPAPESPTATEEVLAAERAVQQADTAVTTAAAALTTAQAGPTRAARLEQDNLVREQERLLRAAQAGGDPAEVAAATDALELARARRDDALARPSTAAEAAALTAAKAEAAAARSALTAAREATITTLPVSEVVFLSSLPRRVDDVSVRRGSVVDGPVMQASGATLELVASAAPGDAELLTVGMPATFEGSDRVPLTATVAAVEPADSGGADPAEDGGGPSDGGDDGAAEAARMTVTFTPQALDAEQLSALQGRNVRVSVPVAATGGEVLAVPVAALTAGPGGESRVERSDGGTRTELVTVQTGLSAEGYVEITGGDLEAGDLVVVGR